MEVQQQPISTKSLISYLLTTSSLLVISAFLLRPNTDDHHDHLLLSRPALVWPELEVSWRSAVATLVGFFGSAFGTVGGVGGGGIFVPMLNLVVGFDTKSAAALSKCMIMGASASSVWYNLRVSHPFKDAPVLDYHLALLFQPMLMLGITIGVSLSVVFPYWLITVLIIILFMGTSSRSFFKAIQMWKQETILKKAIEEQERKALDGEGDEVVIDSLKPLLPKQEKTAFEKMCSNLRWRGILILMLVWISFLILQIIKNGSTVCGPVFWVVNLLQFPVSISVFVLEATKLYKASKERRTSGNWEGMCEANIEWSIPHILFCALCGILGGTVGGLLGSGGGFILGPLLLELGVIPQVASATATFVMMFSSSLSVVEFYFLKRFPIPYALYLMSVSILAGFWGQYFVRKLVVILGRASIIVFILSSVIFASALTMGSRVGVCYGMLGNDLPTKVEVVELYKQHKIDKMRIYNPEPDVLNALRDSEIELIVDVPWENLKEIASSTYAAGDWVKKHILRYWPQVKFKYIGVGNEVIPTGGYSPYVLPAMKNIHKAIGEARLQDAIKVSTVVHSKVLGTSYPPSKGSFSSESMQYMDPIVKFLSGIGSPLLCNVYPFFAYIGDPENIRLDYALFKSEEAVVHDGDLHYQNLFDAMVDSFYAAMEKVDASSVGIVISETGWPSNGGFGATIENANTHNQNAINHVEKGTPRRPSPLEAYIFAMFNENEKPRADTEKHFGLFYPHKKPVYPIEF